MSSTRDPVAPGPVGSSPQGELSEHEKAILAALSHSPYASVEGETPPDDDPQEMKTVIGATSPFAAKAAPPAAPPQAPPPEEDPQEYKTVIGGMLPDPAMIRKKPDLPAPPPEAVTPLTEDAEPDFLSILEALSKPPAPLEAAPPAPPAKPAQASPPVPVAAPAPATPPAPVAATPAPATPPTPPAQATPVHQGKGKGKNKHSGGAAKPAPVPAQPVQVAPPPKPAAEEEEEPEYKTIVLGGMVSPFAAAQAAALSQTPLPPATPAAQTPPPVPAPEEDDEPVYKTIVLGGIAESPAQSSAPKPSAMDEEPEYRTIIVDDSLLASGTSPGMPAFAPPKDPATPTGGDIFGKKTGADPATGTGAPTQRDPTQNTAQGSTGGTWSGQTGGGGATQAVTTGGTPLTGKPTLPEVGGHMAQYEVIRKLGEGGMGVVFLARDTRLGRRVAIKFLTSTNPELTQRFIIEARATARVEHENIVSIYEVGEWGGYPYMVLQFLQGQELGKLIPRGKQMPVPRVVEIMTPVLRALAYAHSEGIVHRDLKPDNIFVTDGGVTKVLDFGIAKVVQGEDKTSDGEGKVSEEDIKKLAGTETGMTRHGAIMGTMPFMSPEQWGNGVTIDHTTDIWAVGVMMYMMLSGKHPLYPLTGQELMVTGFIDEPTPSLREHAPDLPHEVIDVVDKCLKKRKEERWADALALLRALEPLAKARAAADNRSFEESPYAGLSSFQEEDASRFFGRSREIAAMTQRLRERPLMAVVGPSGVGKSSFLRAGVVPALKNSGEQWEINVIRPGRSPLMSLANLVVSQSQTSANIAEDLEQQQMTAKRLATEPGYLGTVLRRQARREKKRILLFIDQFEELYTLVPDQDERLAYTASLLAAADDPTSPMRVVVSIRSDFLDRCVEDQQFMNELSQGLFFLTAPNREGMREALVAPAQMAGYKFENDGIVNEMLDHLASTSGALPLLQFTADKLWGERDPSKRILTDASYRALGGIAGALASHADRTLEGISGEQKNFVRALFLRLVTPDRTRAIVSMDELRDALGKQNDVQSLIDTLVAARLLVVQTVGGGVATVEIVHESLIHGWPQLTRWLDEGQEDSAFLEQMRNAARQWKAKNKDTGLLWRGEMVEEAKRFVRRYRGNLPEHEAAFLKAVIDNSNRAARIKKTLYVVAAVVVLAMLAAAAVALVVINESREETRLKAIAALDAEKKATAAAAEAEKQKESAEVAKEAAEKALAEAKLAEAAKEEARKKEAEALQIANMSKEQLQVALGEAKEAEKRAVKAAAEASAARGTAEQRAREATEARNAANKSAEKLAVALEEVKKAKLKAEADAAEAIRKLKEVTRGGVIEVLK